MVFQGICDNSIYFPSHAGQLLQWTWDSYKPLAFWLALNISLLIVAAHHRQVGPLVESAWRSTVGVTLVIWGFLTCRGIILTVEDGCGVIAGLSFLACSMLLPLALCLLLVGLNRFIASRLRIAMPWTLTDVLAVSLPLLDFIFATLLILYRPADP